MGDTPRWLIEAADGDGERRAWCADTLAAYYADVSTGRPAYTGASFDTFGDNPPDRITSDDLLAVSLLDLPLSGAAILRFLGPDADAISTLLACIPDDVDMHDAEITLIDHDSHAEALWELLRPHDDLDGTGPSRTAKLLARKRPRLLPIFDSVVEQLSLRGHWDHWTEVHRILGHDARFVDVLLEAREQANLPHEPSILRVFDVLLWMSHPRRRQPN